MISSPEANIPLDQATAQAIEQGKNQVTLLQAEVARLTKLQSQINRDIVNLATTKSNLEASILILQSQSDKLTSDNAILQENVKTANLTLENIKSEQSTVQSNITQQQADLADKTNKYLADREQLTQDQTVLNLDKELFAKEQEEHKVKKSFLQEILTKI